MTTVSEPCDPGVTVLPAILQISFRSTRWKLRHLPAGEEGGTGAATEQAGYDTKTES